MRNYHKQKMPTHEAAHPIVRWIWDQINFQRISQQDVAERSGVSSSALRKWRNGKSSPRLSDLEAVLSTLGFALVVSMKEDKQ